MRKQAVSCITVFFSKSCLLHACYLLVEPLKKGVFWSGGIWSGKSLPKWQTVNRRQAAEGPAVRRIGDKKKGVKRKDLWVVDFIIERGND
jgi:hypothetical protein